MKRLILLTCTYPRRAKTRKRNVDRPFIRHYFIERMISILRFVPPPVEWLVIDDNTHFDTTLNHCLTTSGLMRYEWNIHHITHGPTRNSGNSQKDLALTYAASQFSDGVVYIMDDDNMWHPDLFSEIRKTERLSAFPIGNMGTVGVEKPILGDDGKVVDWQARFKWRHFCVDMGEFAFDISCMKGLLGKKPLWPKDEHGGEDQFLRQFVKSNDEFEPLLMSPERVLVHHNEPLGSQWQIDIEDELGIEHHEYPDYVNGF